MNFELSVPSKTFLLGEYLAMQTGEAVIAATGPRFSLYAQLVKHKISLPFHKDSPAGRLLRDGGNFELQFQDPHEGRGGFGRSTAEFLFAVFLKDFRSILTSEAGTAWTPQAVLKAYRKTFAGQPYQPSGADVLAQFEGGLSVVNGKRSEVQKTKWFSDLSFSIFHTGVKVATHEHLAQLGSFDSRQLHKIYQDAVQSISDANSDAWLSAVTEYRKALQALGFEAQTTTELLDQLLMDKSVLAAKGCGAMGSDVVVCFHKDQDGEKVQSVAKQLGLRFVSGSGDLQDGFQFQRVMHS